MGTFLSVGVRYYDLMTEHGEFLESHDNVYAAVTVNTPTSGTSAGGVPKAGVLYPAGHLLHSVLTRRAIRNKDDRRRKRRGESVRCPSVHVRISTYVSQVQRSGRIGLNRLLHSYDLMRPINHGDSGRDPEALPSYRGWLIGAACEMIEAIIAVRDRRSPVVFPSAESTDFFVPIHESPSRILIDTDESKTIALGIASGSLGCALPVELCPVDGVIAAVYSDHESDNGAGYSIAVVPLECAWLPGQELPAETVVLELPSSAVLDPAVQVGVRVEKGAQLAHAVPRQRYIRWEGLAKVLKTPGYSHWYQRQAVCAVDGSEFAGHRRADFQDPISNWGRPVYEALKPDRPLVSVVDSSYNRDESFTRATPAVDVNLWSLPVDERQSYGSHPHHRSAGGRADS